jgi:hypothetical protein
MGIQTRPQGGCQAFHCYRSFWQDFVKDSRNIFIVYNIIKIPIAVLYANAIFERYRHNHHCCVKFRKCRSHHKIELTHVVNLPLDGNAISWQTSRRTNLVNICIPIGKPSRLIIRSDQLCMDFPSVTQNHERARPVDRFVSRLYFDRPSEPFLGWAGRRASFCTLPSNQLRDSSNVVLFWNKQHLVITLRIRILNVSLV